MTVEEAIELLERSNPITKEYRDAFECAIACMRFAMDFVPFKTTPERMEHALHLLSALEYIAKN